MKKSIITGIVLLVFAFQSYSQFSFSVSPGLGLNSAIFGYKVDDQVMPYFGFQYLNGNFKYEESGTEYDYDINQFVSYTEEGNFSGSVLIPNLGLKVFFPGETKVTPFLNFCISKPILSGKVQYDGETDYEFEEAVKNIKLFGLELGFGAEYYLDDNFSFGGEFGLRYFHFKFTDEYETEVYNPETGEVIPSTVDSEYNANLSPTYARLSFNFYF